MTLIHNFKKPSYLYSYLSISCILLSIFLWLQFKHEFWGDEAQAYLIARDSKSIRELLTLVQYEATPPLWHLLIYFSLKLNSGIVVLKILHALLYTGILVIVYFIKPCQYLIHKLLFLSSYWIFFEWGIINRSYLLGVFFLLLAVFFLQKEWRSKYLWYLLFAGLASLTNGHTLILIVSLTLALFLSGYRSLLKNTVFYIAILVFLPLFMIAVFFMRGTKDGIETSKAYQTALSVTDFSDRVITAIGYAGEGYFFLQRKVNDNQFVWQNNWFKNSITMQKIHGYSVFEYVMTFGALAVSILSILTLWRHQHVALLFFIFSFCLMLLANSISPIGVSLRHKGFYFLALFITLNLLSKEQYFSRFIIPLFVLSTFSCLIMVGQSFRKPFSNSKACANYLQSDTFFTSSSNQKIAGHYWQMAPVIAYANLSAVYIPAIDRWVSYTKLDSTLSMNWAIPLSDTAFIERAIRNSCDIIIDSKKNDSLYRRYQYTPDSFFAKNTLQYYERYFIYKRKYK